MEKNIISVGLKGKTEEVVTPEKTAAAVGSGLIEVYSTPSMIALMEKAASTIIQPLLADGENSVGVEIHVFHVKPTAIGKKIFCDCEVTEVDGRKIVFKVRTSDEDGDVGHGTHVRYIINTQRFMQRLKK